MKIYAFHLLNDFSGSPKVLKQLIKGWVNKKVDVTLVTCQGTKGFLSNLQDVNYIYFPYKWSANRFMRLINFFYSQLIMMIQLWAKVKKDDIIYVNTILPFGAGILGKLKGCQVIYHVHETSIKPLLLKKFLFGIISKTASDVIYVSNYLSEKETIKKTGKHTLYNAIENEFLTTASSKISDRKEHKNVLMLASLKAYKGILEFAMLASNCPEYSFKLVVNASTDDVNKFFIDQHVPSNLSIFPTQTNTHPFYEWADIVVNLSRPDAWIETFGLTIVEAMAYHLPVIVPPIGGITELVENGINGYQVDSRDQQQLQSKLKQILNNEDLYKKMRKSASQKIKYFSEDNFISNNLDMLNVVSTRNGTTQLSGISN